MEYREFFEYLRGLLQSGAISYEDAKSKAAGKLAEMNARGAEIARKHGRKFKPFTFSGMMR